MQTENRKSHLRHKSVLAVRLALSLALLGASACSEKSQQTVSVPYPNCPSKFVADDAVPLSVVTPTDAGMHALWNPKAFAAICSFETWEAQLVGNESIELHIRKGSFVPIYVHSDGSPKIEVRIGSEASPAALTEVERALIKQQSEPYLFVSEGLLNISGIEYIGGSQSPSTRTISIPDGRWSVVIHLLESKSGQPFTKDDDPADFLALINPTAQLQKFRTTVETFAEPVAAQPETKP